MPVVVNRTLITDAEINEESARVDVDGISARNEEAARRLIVRELLTLRAREHGLDIKTDLDAAIEELLNREVTIPEVDDTACRRYFESNPERFQTSVTAELRHILIKAAPDDPEERAQAEERASSLIEQLVADRSRFAELAAQWSVCPSAGEGGYLGFISRGQTVPEFEAVVLRLEPGLAVRSVETRYGFHVVEVLAREGGEALPYESVRELIADYLRERSWRRAVHQYIQILIDEADIRGVEFPQSDSPLIQ
ncbi:MAG: peptidylprolyl isomerase [Gammaproteobacteria bacterium]|nr:peptidylprolyl isomerase [Gammaproteobacteria bacterium]